MSDFGDALVSRSDIARMAGVRRPAVTNWERRHPDFPEPVAPSAGSDEPEAFRADRVLEWLSGRTVPANALRPGEPTGTTYGDRFRSAWHGSGSGNLLTAVEQLSRRDADRLRGRLRISDYLDLLLTLVFARSQDQEQWSRYVDDPETILQTLRMPEGGEVPLAEVVRFLDDTPQPTPAEGRQAFDRLLELFSSADARAAEEFFTPRSVSRVMGRVLAAQGPAKRLHDPFCRTGELLTAYLDAATEHGAAMPEQVVGRAPREEFLRIAQMNLAIHGARHSLILPGRHSPARSHGLGDAPGSFDAVITNPPFGSVGPWPDTSPAYWRYGASRSREFDWLQYVVSCLAPGGRAAVLMPAGAGFRGSAERETRARLVEDGVVECVMSLPPQLFELTSVQTHIWLLRSPRMGGEEVLFVDGSGLGSMATRTRRELSDAEIDSLVRSYASWRQTRNGEGRQAGLPRLSRPVSRKEIAAHDHRLEPALYVREHLPSAGAFDDPAAARARLVELSAQLRRLHAAAGNVDNLAEEQLRRYGL
ncbi:N-6 DNA methylase [Streptomyces sp. SID5643]|uniref:N-6 DNA methylase n=1 Tax=Streptomyces sp. SID5643 TaxID=2690307 RepID=UPI001370FFB2|nr:N-6 DNA methylase [Streptomyces sp. SID5643]MZF90006.1 N-6 DNA methylase [Streptomyces sp. SID5643]